MNRPFKVPHAAAPKDASPRLSDGAHTAFSPTAPAEAGRGKRSLELPGWADNDIARRLLLEIITDQPDERVFDACGFKVIEYRGKAAAKLRGMFNRESERLFDLATEQERAGVPWAEAGRTWTSFIHGENADALIGRVLKEASNG